MAEGTRLDGLYYEVDLVSGGMDAGVAAAEAKLKTIEDAAARAGVALGTVPESLGAALTEAAKNATAAVAAAEKATEAATTEASAVRDTGAATKEAAKGYATLAEAQKAWVAAAGKDSGTPGRMLHGPLAASDIPSPEMVADAKKSGKRIADDLLAGVKEEFAARSIEIEQQVRAGLLNAEQALAQRRQLASARNAAVLDAVDTAAAAGKLDGAKGGDVLVSLAGNLKNVEQASVKTGISLKSLRSPLTSLATQAIGASSSAGQLVSSLGFLGVGATVTLGITAAAALIGIAWDAMTEKARAAADKSRALVQSLLAQSDAEKSIAEQLRAQVAAIEEYRKAEPGFKAKVRAVIAGAQSAFSGGDFAAGASASLAGEFQEQDARGIDARRVAEQKSIKATQDADETRIRNLGRLIAVHKASNAEQEYANRLVAGYREEQAALAKTPSRDLDGSRRAQLQGYIDTLTAGDKAAEKSATTRGRAAERSIEAQTAALRSFDSAIAAQTPGSNDNLNAQIKSLTEAAVKAGVGAETIAKKTAELRSAAAARLADESQKLARDLTKQLVSETGSQADQLREGLKDFDASVTADRAKGLTVDPALVERLRAAKVEAIALADQSERLQVLYQGIDDDIRLGGNLIRDMAQVSEQLAQAEADKAAAQARYNGGDRTAYRDLQAAQSRINTLLGKQNELQSGNQARIEKIAAASANVETHTEKLAGQISDAANAAVVLASAFGEVGRKVAGVFGGVAQVSGGIKSLFAEANKKGPNGEASKGFGGLLSSASGIASLLPGAGQVVSGILQGVSAVSSLFGENPAIKAAREESQRAMNSLRDALLTLKDAYLQNVSGTNIKADQAFAAQAAALGANGTINGRRILADGEGNGPGRRGDLREIGKALGLDFDSGELLKRFKELDARYGSNLGSFVEREAPTGLLNALKTLPDALKQAIGNLGAFSGTDPASIISRVGFQLDLLGKSDAATRIHEVVKALEGAGVNLGEFRDELDQLTDPNLAPDVRDRILASLSERLGTGTNLDLGGLTGEQLRQLILDASKASDATTAEKGLGSTGFDRTITEVTGSRMAALFSTGNIFAEQTSRNTALIASLLGGNVPVPVIYPPSLPSGGFGNSTVTLSGDFKVTVVLAGDVTGLTPANTAAIGQAAGDAVSQALRDPSNITLISRGLKADINWANRANGEIS